MSFQRGDVVLVKMPSHLPRAMPEQLKALSIRQPYAEQILRGLKTVEYRSSATKFRGKIYIYASLKLADDDGEFGEGSNVSIDDLPRGVVVGTVEIIDCVQDGDDYEWQLVNPQRLAVPLPPQEHPRATEHAGGKPWKYLLIPHNEIDESKTLAGLAASWEFHA